jgi:hypothetical protein
MFSLTLFDLLGIHKTARSTYHTYPVNLRFSPTKSSQKLSDFIFFQNFHCLFVVAIFTRGQPCYPVIL